MSRSAVENDAWRSEVEKACRHNYRAHSAPYCRSCVDDAGMLLKGAEYVYLLGDDAFPPRSFRCPQCKTSLMPREIPPDAVSLPGSEKS